MKALIIIAILYLCVCTCQVIISPEGPSRQCVVDSDVQEQLMIMNSELRRTIDELRNTTEQLRRTTEQLNRTAEEQKTTKEQLQKLERKVKKITQDVERIDVSQVKNESNEDTNVTYDSCADLPEATPSGIYNITPSSGQMLQVYCDMVTDGGGWTVFQRRQDGSENFIRNWTDYKDGFGNLDGEFWLGNEALALITSQRPYKLRVDMEAFDGRKRYAVYSNFSVAPSADKYRLTLGSYTGDAGNSLGYHRGQQFSTYDQDNDDWSTNNCAAVYKGGWWFWDCSLSHLNGEYLGEGSTPDSQGVYWRYFTGEYSSLKYSAMKIRPY